MANWLGVVCAEHVARGVEGGFAQVCHGKRAPLARMKSGDGMIYYSPSVVLGKSDGFQSFTAIGYVREGVPYEFEMAPGFIPFRRDIDWITPVRPVPIKPLLDIMAWTKGRSNWGYGLRFGILEISSDDFAIIAKGMGVDVTQ